MLTTRHKPDRYHQPVKRGTLYNHGWLPARRTTHITHFELKRARRGNIPLDYLTCFLSTTSSHGDDQWYVAAAQDGGCHPKYRTEPVHSHFERRRGRTEHAQDWVFCWSSYTVLRVDGDIISSWILTQVTWVRDDTLNGWACRPNTCRGHQAAGPASFPTPSAGICTDHEQRPIQIEKSTSRNHQYTRARNIHTRHVKCRLGDESAVFKCSKEEIAIIFSWTTSQKVYLWTNLPLRQREQIVY